MPPRDDGSWERLGALLVQRRIEMDPRYRNRRLFAAERGMNWRLLHDIENAKRSEFRAETLAAIEVAYGLVPGSIARILAGGELEPAAILRPQAVPHPEAGDGADPAEILFPGDPVLQGIWRLPWSEEDRAAQVRAVRRGRGMAEAEGKDRPAGLPAGRSMSIYS